MWKYFWLVCSWGNWIVLVHKVFKILWICLKVLLKFSTIGIINPWATNVFFFYNWLFFTELILVDELLELFSFNNSSFQKYIYIKNHLARFWLGGFYIMYYKTTFPTILKSLVLLIIISLYFLLKDFKRAMWSSKKIFFINASPLTITTPIVPLNNVFCFETKI